MIRSTLIALAIAQSSPAWAQVDDAALRRQVDELNARVSAIEKRLGAAVPTPSVAPAAYPTAWLHIQAGMTRDEVGKLLGEPEKTFELDGSLVWYYRYRGGGAGSVFFDSAGRASSFQRPSAPRVW